MKKEGACEGGGLCLPARGYVTSSVCSGSFKVKVKMMT